MYLYLNASICGALLEPLLELQVSRTGVPYAAQDLGEIYPTATDPTVAPTQGVERECPRILSLVLGSVVTNVAFAFVQSPGTCSSCSSRTRGYPAMERYSRNMYVEAPAMGWTR